MERYGNAMSLSLRLASLALLLVFAAPVAAQTDREVPYWASIRVKEVNMRVGPGGTYKVAWVYHREQLPLKVLRLKEGWRLVEDPDGVQGWVLGQFLSLDRTAMVQGQGLADMRGKGSVGAKLMWRLEPGVVGRLGDCEAGWCRFVVGPHIGFVEQDRLWGAGKP
jgi:SH3-like domain-containing protein